MGACAWCMEPAFAVVVPVRCVSSANGNGSATAKPRQVSVLLHPLRVGPAPLLWRDWSPQRTSACLYPARAAPTPRGAPATFRRFATHHGCDPLPCAACALAPLVGRAARSQCAHGNFWASSDHVCLASQQTLLPHSVSRRRNFAFPRRSTPSSRISWLLRVKSSRPLFPAGSHFFLSSAFFALHPTGLAGSSGFPARFCMTFAY